MTFVPQAQSYQSWNWDWEPENKNADRHAKASQRVAIQNDAERLKQPKMKLVPPNPVPSLRGLGLGSPQNKNSNNTCQKTRPKRSATKKVIV